MHSGGTSPLYLPCCLIRVGKTAAETAQLIELMHAFGAPIGSISDGSGGGGATTLSATAQALGIPALATELGGGASLSRAGETLARDGVLRVLKHMGILPAAIVEPAGPTRSMRVDGRQAFTYAPVRGIFEPAVTLGDEVRAGDLAGTIHPIAGPSESARSVQFAQSGLVACQRARHLPSPETACLSW
ncbi:succinylglutamate desuccinylase/aspartoacylase family protein [Aminobacter anthyllidis]|nr:succinylglutamate desuccinylase/aspartoacylase family protein [Aminobacter anthyllidis]MDH4984416.1 succinylglutamate desuccinylase/aspartoacylase family protein [Aminobacter anthyllidis]